MRLDLETRLRESQKQGLDGFDETIGEAYVCFFPGNDFIYLDGSFTAPQLEEIIAFMRNHPTKE